MTFHAPSPHKRQTSTGELEEIARRLEPPLPPRKPYFISREDIAINEAEQRVIASLERINRACADAQAKERTDA